MFTDTQHSNVPIEQLRNELPTHESVSGTDFRPTHGGVGSLPGGRDESGVARLPDERAQDQNPMSANTTKAGIGGTGTVPGTQQPLSSAEEVSSIDQTRANAGMQSHLQENTNANVPIPGTYGYDPQTQSKQHQPSRVEQVEGDVGHDDKPSLTQRMKQGIKDMTGLGK